MKATLWCYQLPISFPGNASESAVPWMFARYAEGIKQQSPGSRSALWALFNAFGVPVSITSNA